MEKWNRKNISNLCTSGKIYTDTDISTNISDMSKQTWKVVKHAPHWQFLSIPFQNHLLCSIIVFTIIHIHTWVIQWPKQHDVWLWKPTKTWGKCADCHTDEQNTFIHPESITFNGKNTTMHTMCMLQLNTETSIYHQLCAAISSIALHPQNAVHTRAVI